jgi:hypothetical protein
MPNTLAAIKALDAASPVLPLVANPSVAELMVQPYWVEGCVSTATETNLAGAAGLIAAAWCLTWRQAAMGGRGGAAGGRRDEPSCCPSVGRSRPPVSGGTQPCRGGGRTARRADGRHRGGLGVAAAACHSRWMARGLIPCTASYLSNLGSSGARLGVAAKAFPDGALG